MSDVAVEIVEEQPSAPTDTISEETVLNSVENEQSSPAADVSAEATASSCDSNTEQADKADDNDDLQTLVGKHIDKSVAEHMVTLFKAGIVKLADLDERTLEFIVGMRPEHSCYVLKQFGEMSLYGVKNRAAYLSALLKHFRDRVKAFGVEASLGRPMVSGPKEEDVKALIERTEYPLEVTIGQRKYGGPPPDYDGPIPGAGCEIYVGKIPRTVFETELVPLFEQCGKLYDVRVMMDPVSGTGKGYAFVTFMDRTAAAAAAKKFEGYEIKPGKRLRVNVSVANTRLFVGNIPKSKGKEEILEEFSKVAGTLIVAARKERPRVTNIVDVVMYSYPNDPVNKKNRGFCFLDFVDHKSASQAKRRLGNSRFRPWNMEVVIEWAETQDLLAELDDSKNKTLYIRPVKESITEDILKEEFSKYGNVERVKRIKDYAFVHFSERDEAVKAMENMKGHELDGVPCEISFAKPATEKTKRKKDGPMMRSNPVGELHRVEPFIRPFERPSFRPRPQSIFSGTYIVVPVGSGFGNVFMSGYEAGQYNDACRVPMYGTQPMHGRPFMLHTPPSVPMNNDMRFRSPMGPPFGGPNMPGCFPRPGIAVGPMRASGGPLNMRGSGGRGFKRKMPVTSPSSGSKRRDWSYAKRY
ncbi:Heterogeneous nuclear ribonucleoprotein Q [Trichuris trichiura]|uniref:Heterogeneous nuclear ribonucleoprotein Q n=1 Tax=Trichuris trichiura TaxID=36087 RepID=A0A077Z4F6_TRITR|nr:Heterogeneous nuclear ribonucleoprotein Q [Trichuris trichiura]